MPPTPIRLLVELPSLVPFVAPERLAAERGVEFTLRLGANESAFGPSPKAVAAAAEFNVAHYGDPQATALRGKLASRHGCGLDELLVASGIDELLSLFCRAFVSPGETVVTTEGTYPTFEFAARGAGAQILRVPYRDDQPDLSALAGSAQGAKIVYLANPDNPSGFAHPPTAIENFAASLPSDTLLLLDEAYADFLPAPDLAVHLNPRSVVRLRTFSKAYGLAGMRIGYALTAAEHVAAIDKIRLHFGVNGPAQAAASVALADQSHLARVLAHTVEQRERLAAIGLICGLKPLPSSTNFVLFDAGSRARAEALLDRLLDEGVFVRKPGLPPLDRCVRITVGTAEQIDRLEPLLIRAVAELFGAI